MPKPGIFKRIGETDNLQTEAKNLTDAVNEVKAMAASNETIDEINSKIGTDSDSGSLTLFGLLRKTYYSMATAINLEAVKTAVDTISTKLTGVDTKTNNLDATMTSRAPADTALSKAVWTDQKAGFLDAPISDKASQSSVNALGNKIDGIKLEGGIRQVEFISNRSWTVPDGVTKIRVTACGGGGSGAPSSSSNGSSGGQTIVGGVVVLYGGQGGQTNSGGKAGGPGGGDGGYNGGAGGSGIVSTGGSSSSSTAAPGGGSLGGGGCNSPSSTQHQTPGYSPFGNGGAGAYANGSTYNGALGGKGGRYGGGGGIGAGGSGNYNTGGGGGAAAIYKKAYTVTPGQVIPITIGEGGTQDISLNCGGGGNGYVLIEY